VTDENDHPTAPPNEDDYGEVAPREPGKQRASGGEVVEDDEFAHANDDD
jgi:hypothetical protein